jgi:HlyD family secretion protein
MSTAPVSQDDALARIVTENSPKNRLRRAGRVVIVVILIAAAAAVYLLARTRGGATGPQYRTEQVTRGSLTVKVSATGNLQPTNEVTVGSEVSGLVDTVLVEENDHVKVGQVLARLDTSKLEDQVVNSRAALTAAEAKVLQSAATVKEATANLSRLRQVAELSGGKVPSKSEMETAEATLARAQADEASGRAAVEQARALLSSEETNLAKASIRSPINGIVLSREVEPGQTVAASFQTPTLFTLAEDLAQMRLEVDVDEADVGQVKEGQSATFSVDAYPNRKYPAAITRVGYGSQTKEGVVFYTALLTVNNDDLSLRPGMTATADITTVELSDALLVPNAALRFVPPAEMSTPQSRGGIVGSLLPRPPGPPAKTVTTTNADGASGKVWVLRDGQLVALPVTVGHTDGRLTAVSGAELEPGLAVVVERIGEGQ